LNLGARDHCLAAVTHHTGYGPGHIGSEHGRTETRCEKNQQGGWHDSEQTFHISSHEASRIRKTISQMQALNQANICDFPANQTF
jgi:hypothetical protein